MRGFGSTVESSTSYRRGRYSKEVPYRLGGGLLVWHLQVGAPRLRRVDVRAPQLLHGDVIADDLLEARGEAMAILEISSTTMRKSLDTGM